MKLQLIRHATMIIEVNGNRILVDPVFSKAGALEPIPGAANLSANPLVELPVDPLSLIDAAAIIVTHTHVDHFDQAAIDLLPRFTPIFCQPEDREKIMAHGFTDVTALDTSLIWNRIEIIRTGGQHGTGKIGQKMGPVSGFVLKSEGEPTIYIAGDTIWCPEVQTAIEKYAPSVIVVFAGCAQFSAGDPITMGFDDIKQVCLHARNAKVVAVHLEAWNHCSLTRRALLEYLKQNSLSKQVFLPSNGEEIIFNTDG